MYITWNFSGGVFVKVVDRMFFSYEVTDKPRTYRFKLTIWDPKSPERFDVDYINVDINGGI